MLSCWASKSSTRLEEEVHVILPAWQVLRQISDCPVTLMPGNLGQQPERNNFPVIPQFVVRDHHFDRLFLLNLLFVPVFCVTPVTEAK